MIDLGPFGIGVAAGLGIALPLGAIGVLIVREAVERGLRPAAVAALAVALVDFGYALLAVVLGQRLAEQLAGYERAIQVIGAIALAAVVVVGLRSLWRSARGPAQGAAEIALPTARVFGRFVALTAVNPMTAVYFVALTAGLSDRVSGAGDGLAFAVGVLVGSLSWQLVLAFGGALAGGRMSAGIRIGVSLVGYTIVAAYAVRLATGS
jgi:arginine exporter protein ArgO